MPKKSQINEYSDNVINNTLGTSLNPKDTSPLINPSTIFCVCEYVEAQVDCDKRQVKHEDALGWE